MAEWKAERRVFRNQVAQQFQLLQRNIFGCGSCKIFGYLIESDFAGVVGRKPNYCLEKLKTWEPSTLPYATRERKRKNKCIVFSVVQRKNKAIGRRWKRLTLGRDLSLFAGEGRGLGKLVEDMEGKGIIVGTGS